MKIPHLQCFPLCQIVITNTFTLIRWSPSRAVILNVGHQVGHQVGPRYILKWAWMCRMKREENQSVVINPDFLQSFSKWNIFPVTWNFYLCSRGVWNILTPEIGHKEEKVEKNCSRGGNPSHRILPHRTTGWRTDSTHSILHVTDIKSAGSL